ncbi:nidogen [Diorhabda carinulata]|uniref:nidogen n=1 Tax=Diorhabda carinulata TaxID=1163345 RepID=UPI0025A213E5|nr:nidogen [Diorhabda carinulata]
MRLVLGTILYLLCGGGSALPEGLLYSYNVPEAIKLPRGDDVSSPEIKLREPIVFFGNSYDSIFVNSNGFLSFQTAIPQFINIEFPLDYPIIAPFYSNVDTTAAGTIFYYETENPGLIQRATENVHESFLNFADFQATSLLIVTWEGVGYYKNGADKVNTYQVVISTDGEQSYVEFLYPENGIQWIQGTGDESGLPDARAQAGIISPEGKVFALPGSGTEQVKNLKEWSNMELDGQFIYRIDQLDIVEPDVHFGSRPEEDSPTSCSGAKTLCHIQGKCIDYDEGFCCECNTNYYGNGKHCVKKDVPLRVNGKIYGKINGEKLEGLDLQSYVVMPDGRAYTAISRIPESIGYDIQSLQILGGVIGYLFAKPVRNAPNGYQITGGVFNHTAKITFQNTSQVVNIRQKYLGLDVFDQLRLESDIQGEIPLLPDESRVNIDEYQEEYTRTGPGLIQMVSQRTFRVLNKNGNEMVYFYTVDQSFVFDYCKYGNITLGETWKLKVGKNFINYESREQIIRFGLSNKIIPLGDFDPCEEGRSQCTQNSACVVVDNDSFRCVCNPGYQSFFDGNRTTCLDINECQTGQHECDYNAQCFNLVGSYSCECNPGYEGNGHICDNARSCLNVTCKENAECFENNGVATCRCMAGFRGDGQYCAPIPDHSCHIANNCSPFGYCAIDAETNKYSCSCLPGYEGDGYTCTVLVTTTLPERSCRTENNCSPYGYCTINETTRQYYCVCHPRYEGDGYTCREIETTTAYTSGTTEFVTSTEQGVSNEILQICTEGGCYCPSGYVVETGTMYCRQEVTTGQVDYPTTEAFQGSCDVLNNCHPNASCTYSDLTHEYECICNEKFEGTGYNCEPEIISCVEEDNCHPQATCTYVESLGRSQCICNPGFIGDGYFCSIIGCTSTKDCTPNEECVVMPSLKYECICKEGYERDSQQQCVQIAGSCGGGKCVQNAECLYDDDYQINYCHCKPGYVGDGITECREKIIGCDTLNNCGEHASCRYVDEELTYKCFCKEGYFGDGFSCYAERNCHIDPTMCHAQASCLTDAKRNFICQCRRGYVGNGTICKEISKHEGNYLLLNQGMATLKIPLDQSKNSFRKPVQVKAYQTAVGLDVDCLEGRIYWSDINGRVIRSSALNGTDKNDFITEGIGSPEGISIDWVSRNVYWTDSTLDRIEVANIESKLRRTLFDSDLVNPRGIAVHPQRGKIFWTDWNRKDPKIEWANADGSNRQIFMRGSDVSLPNSLTIDFETEHLCYADAGTKKIECVHIDTKTKHTVAVNCTYPFGITTTDREIYWSDWITKKIERVEKYSLKRLPSLPVPLGGTGNRLFELVAVPQSCPSLTNVCEYFKNQCPKDHICLPNGIGGKSCLCGFNSQNLQDKPECNI